MMLSEKIYKVLHEKQSLQRFLARKYLFGVLEKVGFHITGDHFYEPIPNTSFVAKNYSEKPRILDGITWDKTAYETRVIALIQKYGAEFALHAENHGFREKNHYFRGLDALVLYVLIRDLKPKKIVEVGQGFSSRVTSAALEQNQKIDGQICEFISIDPYARLTAQGKEVQAQITVIPKKVQDVDVESLISDCDFLFIDSSHVYKFGSDVEFEFLEMYGKMARNSIVHIHDIFSPYEYPVSWIVKEKRFWNEQYILENFLKYNAAFEIFLPVHFLSRTSQSLAACTKQVALDPAFKFSGSSFYLKRI